MSYRTDGSVAVEARQQEPRCARLADLLTLSCDISQAGQTRLIFVGELDIASADQAYDYVRGIIDAHGGAVLLDVGGLSFCDAAGLRALTQMSKYAEQAGSSLHLTRPPPRLVKIIRITELTGLLPVDRGDKPGS